MRCSYTVEACLSPFEKRAQSEVGQGEKQEKNKRNCPTRAPRVCDKDTGRFGC